MMTENNKESESRAEQSRWISGICPHELGEWIACVDTVQGESRNNLFRHFLLNYSQVQQETLDPYSQQYIDAVTNDYEVIAGRPYSFDFESNTEPFDINNMYPFSSKNPSLIGEHFAAIALILKNMPVSPPALILDMGVGWGHTSLMLAQSGFHVTALDINKNFLTLIEQRAIDLHVENNIETACLHFDSISSLKQTYDCILFFESFHHCLQHQKLLEDCYKLLNLNGSIIFAGEPIYKNWHIPWGLRLDSLSTYCIHKYGWFELGFDESYFLNLLSKTNFYTKPVRYSDAPTANGFHVTRLNKNVIPFVEVRLPEEYEEGWHPPDIQSDIVWTKGSSRFPLSLFPKSRAYRLVLLNCAPHTIILEVVVNQTNQQKVSSYDIPSSQEQEVIIEGAGDVSLNCQSWSPAAIGLSSDDRHLGIAVRSIELLQEKD
jgi:2-polyprenyl-3-methyl-5-hydroxy-6-metoxy-1,4-benzoquinol methylase